MRMLLLIALLSSSLNVFASNEKIENWKENNLITESSAIDYIYEFAYDRFIGDDGETCEPELEYAELVEFKSNKEFTVKADLSISNINFWACTFLMNDQGTYELKFQYDSVKSYFKVLSLK